VDAAGLTRADNQLDSFVGEAFSPLTQKHRRATAGLYVRGGVDACTRRYATTPSRPNKRLLALGMSLEQFWVGGLR
jgi:hypothetical protein